VARDKLWIAECDPIGQAEGFPFPPLAHARLLMPVKSRRISSIPVITLLLLFCVSCEKPEGVSSYTVERDSSSRPPTDYAAVARSLDHTLAAILPQKDQAWFFKLAGPAPAVERRRDDFVAFLKTVAPATKAGEPPTWQLPDGWEEQGPTRMRAATLVVPDDGGPLEIAVSSLPLTDDWDDFLNRNVNRWLGQLSQPPLKGVTIKKLAKEVATAAGPATLIELAGVLQGQGRTNPHAGMPSARAPQESPPATEQNSATSQASSAGPLSFETPAGWQPGRMSMVRKAAFDIAEDDQKAEMTVIDFPTAGGAQITDVTANVRRWANQVGLAGLDDEDLQKLVKKTNVDGTPGSFVELLGPEDSQQPKGMLAAMVVRGEKVWFFKLSGDRALVENQEKAFQGFLDSVRFK